MCAVTGIIQWEDFSIAQLIRSQKMKSVVMSPMKIKVVCEKENISPSGKWHSLHNS